MTLVFALMYNLPLPLFYNIAQKYSEFQKKVLFVTACQHVIPFYERTSGAN